MDDHNKGFTTANDKSHLIDLDKQKDKILKEREDTWRPKSRPSGFKLEMITQNSFRTMLREERYLTLFGICPYLMEVWQTLSINYLFWALLIFKILQNPFKGPI